MKVQGTQEIVKEIEVNVDTVYVRSNIVRVETEDFIGWEYDEEQYNKDEFIEKITNENTSLKIAQAETNTNLLELMEFILLGGM
ncbi:hypothetical protein [Cytobacillus praedii]|uniref:Uncharacterized protein n=1 Tax=Cytobacillus praedii TaxID=1742358 RepID=A0A4R1AVR9_9BACI|nr:hypothetical protein [Cytobacillus praedii]TCJ01601.1 hypothetical protein E0Y62_23200 [Cytobacillus praedii]